MSTECQWHGDALLAEIQADVWEGLVRAAGYYAGRIQNEAGQGQRREVRLEWDQANLTGKVFQPGPARRMFAWRRNRTPAVPAQPLATLEQHWDTICNLASGGASG